MTRLAAIPQRVALLIVSVVCISGLSLVFFAESGQSASPGPAEYGDSDAYFSILALMSGGSGYYDATHEVLLAHDYGTRSVFNWRTPAWLTLIASFPSMAWASVPLIALAAFALLFAYRMILRSDGGEPVAIAAVIGTFPSLVLLAGPRGIVLSEAVAGMLILLSIACYGNDRWLAGLLAAMAALFIRELAAPYILLSIGFAIRRGSKRELFGWTIGLAAYFAYYAWHWSEIARRLGPADRADPEGWVKFGGIRFVLETAHFNGIYYLIPLWVTAALLPAALVGLFAWREGLRAALTVTAYLCMFVVVGKPFNFYWGALYTPLLMLGLPWSVPAIYSALAPRDATDEPVAR